MPLLRSKYQPYFPDTDSPNNYSCDSAVYCHPVQLGDTIYTQFYQTPCGANEVVDPIFDDTTEGSEEITNGDFTGSAAGWTVGTGWAYGTNNVEHTPGNTDALAQNLSLTQNLYYTISIDIVRTAGSLVVYLGEAAGSTASATLEETGTYTFVLPFLDALDNIIRIIPSSDFDGSVDNVSVKELTYNSWDLNASWEITDGIACHIEGTTGLLEESVANYIDADDYYYIDVTVTGYVAGELEVYIADALAGTVTSNGTFRYYATPTVAGVVSFDPSSDFIGCVSAPDLRKLKNSHSADLVTQDGVSRYDISPYISYWEDKVTLRLNIELLEVLEGCYYIEVFDACQIEGNELVYNGDFADGSTDWTLNNGAQSDLSGGDAVFIYEPIDGLTSELSNGDFSAGTTDWTFGAGWAIGGGGAQHTPGSTATLTQAVTVAAPPPAPAVEVYWLQFTISGQSAGSVTAKFGNSGTFTADVDDTYVFPVTPGTTGSVTLTFTPSSTFDGTIDDVGLFISNTPWSGSPIITNAVNTDFINGNYQLEFEITAKDHPDTRVGIQVLGQSESIQYFDTVGVHQVTINNYVPGAQRVRIVTSFVAAGSTNRRPGTITVDNVSAVRIEPFEATYTSECLNYKEEHSTRTRMLSAYCDQEAFGFEFANTGFRFRQRVEVRSIAPFYPKEKQISKSGTGNAAVVYSGVEKYWQLHTGYVTETTHDALAIMVDCDHFLVGETAATGKEYIAEVEDYTPQWLQDGSFSLAPAVITVRIKEDGQQFNRHV